MANYHRETELLRYARRRSEAYAHAASEIREGIGVEFSLQNMNSTAIRAWRTGWLPLHRGDRPGEWDWAELANMYLRTPDAFHLAIWSGDVLCGLAVGSPSNNRASLSVHFMEGCPEPTHPLKGKILALTLVAADAYGAVLGAGLLRLKNPAPGLLPTYRELGFQLAPTGSGVAYCERRIE